jgi:hypothetical protein
VRLLRLQARIRLRFAVMLSPPLRPVNLCLWSITLPHPHSMMWGLGVSIGFWFFEDGNVSLLAAGADFQV